jgi:hypothetical protein
MSSFHDYQRVSVRKSIMSRISSLILSLEAKKGEFTDVRNQIKLIDLYFDGNTSLPNSNWKWRLWSWGSFVVTVSDYRQDDQGSIPGKGKGFFPLASVSRPSLRPAQPPIQWVLRDLSQGQSIAGA